MNKLLLILSLFVITLNSCKKGPDPDIRNNVVSAAINGDSFNALEVTWGRFNEQLTIEGKQDNKTINLTIDHCRGAGTYDIARGEAMASCTINNLAYTASSGKVIIKKDDNKNIAGIFSFSAANPDNHPCAIQSGGVSLRY